MAVGQTSFKPQLGLFAFVLYIAAVVSLSSGAVGVCPNFGSNFVVAFLHDPPYAKANSTKRHGLLYDFVQAGLGHCFHHYRCDMKTIHWREVFSEETLSTLTLDENTDIAIPITSSLYSSLTDELTNSRNTNVTLVTVVKSPGLALVIDYYACKMKIEKMTTDTILSAWPVCAVILLLAGISGISIWALVSHY